MCIVVEKEQEASHGSPGSGSRAAVGRVSCCAAQQASDRGYRAPHFKLQMFRGGAKSSLSACWSPESGSRSAVGPVRCAAQQTRDSGHQAQGTIFPVSSVQGTLVGGTSADHFRNKPKHTTM